MTRLQEEAERDFENWLEQLEQCNWPRELLEIAKQVIDDNLNFDAQKTTTSNDVDVSGEPVGQTELKIGDKKMTRHMR